MKRRLTMGLAVLLVLPCLSVVAAGAKVKGANFFSTPDATSKEVPTFTGKPRIPIPPDSLAPDGEMPRLNDLVSIPSLTGDQRKKINELFQSCRSVTQPLHEEQVALEARQKELKAEKDKAKAAKNATPEALKVTPAVASAPKPTPSKEKNFDVMAAQMSAIEIDARIPVLKSQTKDEYNKLSHEIATLLTSQQISELDSMRHGTMEIKSDSRTDAPAPPPKPASAKSPAPSRRQVHNAAYNQREVWQFLWGLR